MKIQDIDDLITKLNNEYYELNDEYFTPYFLSSSAGIRRIFFLGEQIWTSEDDEREYINEEQDIKEELEVYLRREAKRIVCDLHKVVTGGKSEI